MPPPAAVKRPERPPRTDAFLVLAESELRDSQDLSVLGVVKWLLDPLAYTGMYFLLIGIMLQRHEFAYPLFIMCAVLPWRYFQGVIANSMALMNKYSRVLATRKVPSGILPLVVVATEGVSFVVGLAVLVPLLAYYRIGVTWALLWLPVIVVVLALLLIGPAYLGTLLGLYFPDYRSLTLSLVRIGFLASTALVPLRSIPGDRLPQLIQANPLSGVFDSFRDVLLRGQAPTAAHLLYPCAFGLGLALVGALLYRWREFELAKEV